MFMGAVCVIFGYSIVTVQMMYCSGIYCSATRWAVMTPTDACTVRRFGIVFMFNTVMKGYCSSTVYYAVIYD